MASCRTTGSCRPGTGRAVADVHLNFDQRFTVLGGHARYEVEGVPRALAAGEEILLPRGTAHVDPYPDGTERVVVRNVGHPEVAGARDYARALGRAIRDGNANAQDEFPFLQLMVDTPCWAITELRRGAADTAAAMCDSDTRGGRARVRPSSHRLTTPRRGPARAAGEVASEP